MQIRNTITTALILAVALSGGVEAGAKKHRKPQKPPIKLGSSGGNASHLDVDGNGACLSGTLGALVQGEATYILSTSTALAKVNEGKKGDPIIQPGLIDTKEGSCNPANPKGHTVADLTKYKKIKFFKGSKTPKNQADAALAETREGMVDSKGRVLGIGTPGSHIVEPFLGQRVKKSGRGNGVKTGTVVAVNVVGDVAFGQPPGSPPLARFVQQFVVQSDDAKPILGFGDTGTVFFENREGCPGWVGLGGPVSLPDGQFALVSKMSTVISQLEKAKPKGDLELVGCEGSVAASDAVLSFETQRALLDAELIQNRIQDDVVRLPGVVGIGIGVATDDPDEVVFKVLVAYDSENGLAGLPERLGKFRWEPLETGRFSAR